MVIYLLILFFLFLAPVIWLSYIFKKNDKLLINMPFNWLEFGNNLLEELGLNNVKIEKSLIGDHYDLKEKKIKVSEERMLKKSLTAISIVCHEIGHAIQHDENYKPLEQRTKLVKSTAWISQLGSGLLLMGLPTIFATGSFSMIKICLILVLISMLIGIIVHLITLEVELDASFKKAFPILKKKVPQEYHKACYSVLKAAALTYVIGVIRNFVSIRFIWLLISRLK